MKGCCTLKQFFLFLLCLRPNYGLFEFSNDNEETTFQVNEFIKSITNNELVSALMFGSQTVDREKTLERSLLQSDITVQNGSLSHAQLLDTLPNENAQIDSEVALKILKSSIYIYHTKCLEHGIPAKSCNQLLNHKRLPESALRSKCIEIIQSRREGHHSFRRLLPRNYKDSFYEMYTENQLPLPRTVSSRGLPDFDITEKLDTSHRNIALVQWTQFIEHDLSKPVVTSMNNGKPIECCNKDNYRLLPRYRHPACAPLLDRDPLSRYSRETCLNYVRSALAVGDACTFGAAEQLNQATGYLDLSQLYGFEKASQSHMRLYKDGRLKSSQGDNVHEELLPLAAEELNDFCATKPNTRKSFCFMAGDSRVNSSPYTITIYTIFLRNHNLVALNLKTQYPSWSDEQLFQAAKFININIYRRIVFHEWLPEVLGTDIADAINIEPYKPTILENSDYQVSNEFASAAIRFYFSMMPDALYDFATVRDANQRSESKNLENMILPDAHIFVLREQIYTPTLMYTSLKLDNILESLLHQRAMKMDSTYVASLIPDSMGNIRPTHADVLAFDIQRGRDHGLQPYYKYLEKCSGKELKDWDDLKQFITNENILKMKSVYTNWTDIDLIIGGVSEIPLLGTVGPTFSCILGEQFSKIRQWHRKMGTNGFDEALLQPYALFSAAELLCRNSDLKSVPRNIYRLEYESNQLMSCAGWRGGRHDS